MTPGSAGGVQPRSISRPRTASGSTTSAAISRSGSAATPSVIRSCYPAAMSTSTARIASLTGRPSSSMYPDRWYSGVVIRNRVGHHAASRGDGGPPGGLGGVDAVVDGITHVIVDLQRLVRALRRGRRPAETDTGRACRIRLDAGTADMLRAVPSGSIDTAWPSGRTSGSRTISMVWCAHGRPAAPTPGTSRPATHICHAGRGGRGTILQVSRRLGHSSVRGCRVTCAPTCGRRRPRLPSMPGGASAWNWSGSLTSPLAFGRDDRLWESRLAVKPQVRGGAPPGTRTPNPLIKSQLLCQLS